MSLNEKGGSNILGTFCNPKSIMDSDCESKLDDNYTFVDSVYYKAEDNCKKSKLSESISHDISRVTETLSCVHVSLPKIRPIKNRLEPGTLWFRSDAKKITAKLHSLLSIIDKMSLQEIHSTLLAGQYSYCNFVTNDKRLQKNVQTDLSLQRLDSNNPEATSFNPQISINKMLQKSLCIIQ